MSKSNAILPTLLVFLLLFSSCNQYYYFDGNGNTHATYDKTKEKEIVQFQEQYYYVLRSKNIVAMGNLFDTTNWEQIKFNSLQPMKKYKK